MNGVGVQFVSKIIHQLIDQQHSYVVIQRVSIM